MQNDSDDDDDDGLSDMQSCEFWRLVDDMQQQTSVFSLLTQIMTAVNRQTDVRQVELP